MQVITNQVEQVEAQKQSNVPVHRIVVIDCSGSMGSSLPKIRTALKNKIPTMVQPEDRLSIVWFSGKNEYGVLMEAVQVSTLTDLSTINKSIDRYLTTVGLTAFVQPLEEVVELTKRHPMTTSMFFMSDGADNSYSKKDILRAAGALANSVDTCLLYTSPSPRDKRQSRMPSSA